MPKRKSDATEADDPAAVHGPDTDGTANADAREDAPGPGPESVPGSATPDEAPLLSTPDVAAEPGSPDPALAPEAPPPLTADSAEAIEPYREPDFVLPADAQPPEPEVVAAPPPPPPSHHAAEPEDPHEAEDEGGGSLAARLLMAVLLLLVGGGLALWGAPKLAPHLPSGMSGVAAWLTPGSTDAAARVTALETELGGRIAALEARLAAAATAQDVGTAVEATASRLDGELSTLREQVAALGGSEVPQQVARLQSAVDGQAAEVATLKAQMETAPAAAGATAEVDVYRAELDGVRAEVGSLQSEVAGLVKRVETAEQNADRQVTLAQTRVTEIETQAETRLTAAEAASGVALIDAALASGAPFEAPLEALGSHPGVTVPPALTAAAPTGVATLAALRDTFPDAAHAAIRASIMAGAGEGVLSRTRAFLDAQIASRSLTPQAGSSPDAVLSRVEDKLRHDDLAGAIREAEALPSEAQAALAPWLDAARLREGAVEGLAALDAALPATN